MTTFTGFEKSHNGEKSCENFTLFNQYHHANQHLCIQTLWY